MFNKIYIKATVIILVIATMYLSTELFLVAPKVEKNFLQLEEQKAKLQLDKITTTIKNRTVFFESYKKSREDEYKKRIKNIVQAVESIIKSEYEKYKKGEITEEEAKKRALEIVNTIRYDKSNYIWINRIDYVTIAHPKKSLIGKSLKGLKDPKGNFIVKPMVDDAVKKGEGFNYYYWPRLKGSEPVRKISYSLLFKPWGWAIGNAFYIDDIDKEIEIKKQELLEELSLVLKDMKIGKTGYAYIFNKDGKMLVHPNLNILKGEVFKKLKNPQTGTIIFEDLVKATHSSNKTLRYKWDRPNDKKNYIYDKISWMEYNKYFGWYIGTSVYVDEIYADSNKIKKYMLLITLILLVSAIILGSLYLRKILSPITTLTKHSQKIQEGDFSVRSDIKQKDEVGILANNFNKMIDTIEDHIENLDEKVKDKTKSLSEANKKVMASINYAKRIQEALLPNSRYMKEQIKEFFVLWQPKDILGGDIYVYEKFKDGYLVGVIDCTGHGVPGALMSMIAKTSLSKVINEENHNNPAKIITMLDITIREMLYSKHSIDDNTSDDGMDMALCFVQKDRITFSGAKLPLFVYQDGKVEKIKPSRYSVGYKKEMDKVFENVVIDDMDGVKIYMTTDGYLDQTGGEKGYPMGNRKFISLIEREAKREFELQASSFEEYLLSFQGDSDRKDDITVIGIDLINSKGEIKDGDFKHRSDDKHTEDILRSKCEFA